MLRLVRARPMGMKSNQASEKRISRWVKKREFLSYYLLYKRFSTDKFNIGEAIDVLVREFCMSRKSAFNVFRRIYKMGFIERIDKLVYRCLEPSDILDAYLRSYREKRLKRCKNR